jgi:hypothetical protein
MQRQNGEKDNQWSTKYYTYNLNIEQQNQELENKSFSNRSSHLVKGCKVKQTKLRRKKV